MSGYLFDNAVLDRHAKLANRLPVEPELEFADRLLWLASFPACGVAADDELLDSFLDRKRALATSEAGRIHPGVLLPLAGIGAFAWGWKNSSSSPNGATLTAALIIAAALAIIVTFGWRYRRRERLDAARTKKLEDGLQQDTTGDHIWDA